MRKPARGLFIGFFVCRPLSGLLGVFYLLWETAGALKRGRVSGPSSGETCLLLVRSSASVAPLTYWVPSHVSRAAATATFLTRRSLVLAKHVSISLLLLF